MGNGNTLGLKGPQEYLVPAGRKSGMSCQACDKANEDTYPSPLLVNIILI